LLGGMALNMLNIKMITPRQPGGARGAGIGMTVVRPCKLDVLGFSNIGSPW
jgi:hypothetical protein